MFKFSIVGVIALCSIYLSDVLAQEPRANLPVPQKCLGCICEAISGCNVTKICTGDTCGPFKITWAYWADGGKPTIGQQSPDEPTAYANCANDAYCAAACVQGYMSKFYQDCNGDGKVDCDDYVAIHKLGGYGCHVGLPDFYIQRYTQCKALIGDVNS